ncbi:MAG: hypothetical protein EP332_09965 [Bacteroidetes bacterium]|nr:MAG: hypothetical protein EP332_09965 [Bacteroidota bacterium]
MKKPILYTLSLLFLAACSVADKSKAVTEESFESSYSDYNCLDNLQKGKGNDKSGPIKIHLDIDSFQFGQNVIPIKRTFTLTLNKASDMLIFGDSIGLKFFHTEALVYNKLTHYVKYDLFMKEGNCWKRHIEIGFNPIVLSSPGSETSYGTFSQGFESDADYIRLVWTMKRLPR